MRGVDPRQTYVARLDHFDSRWQSLERLDRRFLVLRSVLGGAFLLLAVLSVFPGGPSAWWAATILGALLLSVVFHRALTADAERVRMGVEYYTTALARLDGDWPGKGVVDLTYLPEAHPYARDLDLFGSGSLFELLCTTRTRIGEACLADWLATPAGPDEITARQASVETLRARVELREDLALLGGPNRPEINRDTLLAWAADGGDFEAETMVGWQTIALLLSASAVTGLVLWVADISSSLLFWVSLLAEWAVYNRVRRRIANSISALEGAGPDLETLRAVFGRIQAEDLSGAGDSSLLSRVQGDGAAAASAIARLRSVVGWLDSRRNMLFAPLAYMAMVTLHAALAITRWRRTYGELVPVWLDALGAFEALAALGGHAFENPHHTFPEIVSGVARFEGEDIGHPLIPNERCVRNTVVLDLGCPLWVVSGSNMSGKTTLLRTVGVNAALAFAGAPVRARSLRLSPLVIGASIRHPDSLTEGVSRFYSEIRRLRTLLDVAAERPMLFLFDEILHGTNSKERKQGAEALLKAFVERGAVGLVTTHDLALTRLETLAPDRYRNGHFTDRMGDRRLVFDYRLRGGVVGDGNALELMRSIGLDI